MEDRYKITRLEIVDNERAHEILNGICSDDIKIISAIGLKYKKKDVSIANKIKNNEAAFEKQLESFIDSQASLDGVVNGAMDFVINFMGSDVVDKERLFISSGITFGSTVSENVYRIPGAALSVPSMEDALRYDEILIGIKFPKGIHVAFQNTRELLENWAFHHYENPIKDFFSRLAFRFCKKSIKERLDQNEPLMISLYELFLELNNDTSTAYASMKFTCSNIQFLYKNKDGKENGDSENKCTVPDHQ